MILFVNVFITDKAILMYDRGRYGRKTNRADIFKYTLASYAVIPWSSVYIYYQLDDNYAHRYAEINSWIGELFPQAKVFNHRNDRQLAWQGALNQVFAESRDELVWFSCNDDHVFVDSSLDFLQRTEAKLLELAERYPMVGCPFSHWTDFVGARSWHDKEPSSPYCTKFLEQDELGAVVEWRNFGSVQIVNRALLKSWFFDNDYGDAWIPRTDGPGRCVISPKFAGLISSRELARHFDGYSHVGVDLNGCPPLEIPPGFFEGQIKIDFLGEEPAEGRLLVNPLLSKYRAVDKRGADLRVVLEELPFFWQGRIAEVKKCRECPRVELLRGHNQAVLELATAHPEVSAGEIIDLIGPAFRTEGLSAVLPEVPGGKSPAPLERIIQRNWRDREPELTIVIFDPMNARGDLRTVESLTRQTVERDRYELIWVAPSSWVAFSAMPLVDTVISGNRNAEIACGTYQKHVGFNLGVCAARGKLIAFVDSEQVFPANFVEAVITSFAEHEIDLLSFSERRSPQSYRGLHLSPIDYAWSEHMELGTAVVRREKIIRLGGFDESLRYVGRSGGIEYFRERFRLSHLGVDASYDNSVLVYRFASERPSHADVATDCSSLCMYPEVENSEIHALRTGEKISREVCEKSGDLRRELDSGQRHFANLVGQGQLLEAEQWLGFVLSKFPNNPLLYTSYASLSLLKGNRELALHLMAIAEATIPGNIAYYCSVVGETRNGYAEFATVAQALGHRDLATLAWEKATRLMPDNAEMYQQYGLSLLALGEAKLAEPQFARAVALDKSQAAAATILGMLKIAGREEEQRVS